MKFKLDENLGESVRRRLAEAAHDVSTVVDQQMAGSAHAAVVEQLVTVAADHDVTAALWIVSVRGVRRFVPPNP